MNLNDPYVLYPVLFTALVMVGLICDSLKAIGRGVKIRANKASRIHQVRPL